MSQGGANSSKGSGVDPIETLSGNSGGPVGPDGSFNVDILGNNVTGINIVGTPSSNLLTVIGLAASETQVGTIELATAAETTTGTSTSLAVHPAGLDTKLGPQTANGLIYGSGGAGSNLASLGEATDGQLPIGNTGSAAVLSTLTAGTNITITNGAGSITIDASVGVTGPGSTTDNALARWNGVGGTAIQDSTVIVSDAGEMTNSSQPAFLAINSVTDSNVTGDDTLFTIICDNEIYDQNGNYDNTTGTFTSPVSGKYTLIGMVTYEGLTASHTLGFVNLVTSNRTYLGFAANCANMRSVLNSLAWDVNAIADMDAGDTCTFTTEIFGGALVVDVQGGAAPNTYFCGDLTT